MDQAERDAFQNDFERLASGDREAFHPVYVRVLPLVRRFVARHLEPAEAEDVAQEALLKVFLRSAQFEPGRSALTWVLTIAAWELKTARRRHHRSRETGDAALVAVAGGGPTPEDAAIASDLERELATVLGDLKPGDAETLVTYARGERPPLPPPTFRKRVERALTRLRAAWSARHGSD